MAIKKLAKSSKSFAKSVLAATNGRERSYEQLKSIEKRRRSILKRQGEGFFRSVWHWDGTLLKILAQDRLMWVTMGLYAAIRVMARFGLPSILNDIAGIPIDVVGGFLSFFLVLYVNDSLEVFNEQYKSSMVCEQRIMDVAALARSTLPRERGLRLIRYLNAAHVAGYIGLGETYTYRNLFTEINKIDRLLTPEETQRMEEINMDSSCGGAYRELVAWALMEISSAEEKEILNVRQAVQFRDLILQMRGGMAELYDQADQPLSFAYTHFICFLSLLYLPMFALSTGLAAGIGESAYWVTDIVSGFIVFLQAIFVVGLRVLAERMADPYGDEVDHLSVMHYLDYTWKQSNRLLAAKKPAPIDPDVEERISRERITIGKAWEVDKYHGSTQKMATSQISQSDAAFEVKFTIDENVFDSESPVARF